MYAVTLPTTQSPMIVKILLPLILAVIMFSLGLGLRVSDFTRVAKFPKAFSMGLANQLVLLPLVAFGVVLLFGLKGEIAVGMMILAFCPGGVTTNVLTRISKGNVPLSISMTAVTSLLSIITVPILVAWSVNRFMGDTADPVNVTKLGIQMCLITALPVGIGMLLTKLAPGFVEKTQKLFSMLAVVLFAFIVLAALIKNWEVVSTNFVSLGPALIVLNMVLLGMGLLTSRAVGLNPFDSSTIGIESGIQNGTLGITVGNLILLTADETIGPMAVPAAVYGITMYLVSLPFVFWRRKVNGRFEATAA